MKKLVFSFFVLLNTMVCVSQNYFPSRSNSILLFNSYNTSYSSFDAAKWDSVRASGQDTIYYSIPFVIDTSSIFGSGICVDTTAGSILGKLMIKTPENNCKIVNFRNDTILILPESATGAQWKLFEFADHSYISAKTDSIAIKTFLGISDSVKYISLSTKNSLGNDIPGIFNSRQILLSKNYGMIQCFNFYKFPLLDTAVYFLKGSQNPDFGIHDITFKDIYNYTVGDEFHLMQEETNWEFNTTDHTWHIDNGNITHTMRYVIDRIDFGIGDSIKYLYHDCKRVIEFQASIPDTSYIQDTLSETIEFSKLNNFDFEHLPFEYIGKYAGTQDSVYFYRLSTLLFGNKLIKSVTYNEVWKMDSCWAYFMVDPSPTPYEYIEGGGGPYHYFADWMGYVERNELIYFNKNGEIWGTSVAADCDDLFSGISYYQHSPIAIDIFPNPVDDNLNIVFSDASENENPILFIYDLSGTEVMRFLLSRNVNTIDCAKLKSGAYFYKIASAQNVKSGKLIVIH